MNNMQQSDKKITSDLKFLILLFVLLFSHIFLLKAQNTWEVPLDKAQKVSPFKFDAESVKSGEEIFTRNCAKCHGNVGKNNPAGLNPSPGDPAGEKFQKETDGGLMYKMTTGRELMPSFKDALSETERWQIISYFRSFHKGYVQPESVTAPAGAFAGMEVDFNLTYQEKDNVLKVLANGTKNNETKPIGGIEIGLFAKSYFGNLPIDEAKTTNANGEAFFEYKEKLKGDTSGNVKFLIKVNTEGLDGVKKEKIINAGQPVFPKSLLDTRAMWTVRSQAPIWLILSYSLAVIGVWSVIIFILTQIKKVNDIGKE